MSEKKRRFLTAVPALAAVLSAVSLLAPASLVSDPVRGAIVGLAIGSSIAALIKLKAARSA